MTPGDINGSGFPPNNRQAKPPVGGTTPPPLIEELPQQTRKPREKPKEIFAAAPKDLPALESPETQSEVQGHLRQAHVLRTKADLAGAAREVKAAIEVSPNDGAAHSMLGDILKQAGRLKDALRSYETAKELLPNGPARAAVESKIARAVLELTPERVNPDSAAFDREGGGIIVGASALAPGLGQILVGQPVKGGIIFGVWLLTTIASAKTSASAYMLATLLHQSTETSLPSTASYVFFYLFMAVSTVAWIYSIVDAVAISRQNKKGTV